MSAKILLRWFALTFVLLGLFCSSVIADAVEPGPNTRLTTDDASSLRPIVAVAGRYVYVAWDDDRDGNQEIYFKVSENGGTTWSQDMRLTQDGASSTSPALVVDPAGVIHLAWRDKRGGTWSGWYMRSGDHGQTWTAPVNVTAYPGSYEFTHPIIDLAADANGLYLVWSDNRNQPDGVGWHNPYYRISTDGGKSWSATKRLSNERISGQNPDAATDGAGNLHVVWNWTHYANKAPMYKGSADSGTTWREDVNLAPGLTTGVNPAIAANTGNDVVAAFVITDVAYVRHSNDDGLTWQPLQPLTPMTATTGGGFVTNGVAADDQFIYAVWYATLAGDGDNDEIFFATSQDGGESWSDGNQLTHAIDLSQTPRVAAENGVAHMVWRDNRDGNWEIYYQRFELAGSVSEPSTLATVRLTTDDANSLRPIVAVAGRYVYVAWDDDRDGNQEIYFKVSENGGTTWSQDMRLTQDGASSTSPALVVDPAGVIHLAWRDKRGGTWSGWYMRSGDHGQTWTAPVNVTAYPGSYEFTHPIIDLAADANGLYLVWSDNRNQPDGVGWHNPYYRISTDGGKSWSATKRLSNERISGQNPDAATDGAGNLHVVWNWTHDANKAPMYKGSADLGTTWREDVNLAPGLTTGVNPAIAANTGNDVVAAFVITDVAYVRHSSDDGLTWQPLQPLTPMTATTGGGFVTNGVAADDQYIYAVWYATLAGDGDNDEIFFAYSQDGGESWSDGNQLTHAIDLSQTPRVAAENGVAHMVWRDNRDGNWEIYYQRLVQQATSVQVGPAGGEVSSVADSVHYLMAADTFTVSVSIVHSSRARGSVPPSDQLGGVYKAYEVQALNAAGQTVNPVTGRTYTVSIAYDVGGLGDISQDTLALFFWNGQAWEQEPSGQVDTVDHQITATPDHFSLWAVMSTVAAPSQDAKIFLPMVERPSLVQ